MKRLVLLLGLLVTAVAPLALTGCSNDDNSPTSSSVAPLAPESSASTPLSGGIDIIDTAIGAGQFTTLVAAVQAAMLEDDLRSAGPFTVFAPDDKAFAKLPAGLVAELLLPQNKSRLVALLSYHVVLGRIASTDLRPLQHVGTLEGNNIQVRKRLIGGQITVNQSIVTAADIFASNGVIHVIDTVLIPPGFTLTGPTLDIVDTAVGAGRFNTLVAAVQAAGLEGALRGPGPLTVFAPTDAAFAHLPAGVLNELLKPKNKARLAKLLQYHVVSGQVLSTDLKPLQFVETLASQKVVVRRRLSDGRITVNFSQVTGADVLATNGVIHVIDRVLIPPGFLGSLLAGR